jgi:hypothetical protein
VNGTVALVVLCLTAAPAPAGLLSGRFKPAGSLKVARSGHTATKLKDGRVLIAGGRGIELDELASAELYDPKTNKWKSVAPMATGRSGHTATLLHDGRVLVAGGTVHDMTSGSERFLALASTELFDPKTGQWTPGPQMKDARHWHSATLLDDGRVLVAGGARENKSYLASAELYEPESNAWSPAAPMAVPRCLHRAVKLSDGSVLITGGRDARALSSVERFEPASGEWSKGPELADPRQFHGAVALNDGRALVIGGAANSGLTNLCELWKPGEEKWSLAEHSLSMAHQAFAAVVLKNGDVLVTGGEPYDAVDSGAAQRFLPGEQRWCLAGTMASGRKHHTATLLDDGRVLVVGGVSGGVLEATAEAWEEAKGACVEPPGISLTP